MCLNLVWDVDVSVNSYEKKDKQNKSISNPEERTEIAVKRSPQRLIKAMSMV